MRHRFVTPLLLWAGLLLGGPFLPGRAGEAPPAATPLRIAVVDFEVDKNIPAAVATGRGLAQLLQANLAGRLGKGYSLVDRTAIEKVLQEQKFSQSALVREDTRKAFGQLLGADLLITGSLVRVGGIHTLSAQLLDVETAAVKIARTLTCTDAKDLHEVAGQLAITLLMSDEDLERYEAARHEYPRWIAEGRAAMDKRDYAGALALFEKAHWAKPGPESRQLVASARTLVNAIAASRERSRQGYEKQLVKAQEALTRARETGDRTLWHRVLSHAQAAINTRHIDTTAAAELVALARKELAPPQHSVFPFGPMEASRQQGATVKAMGLAAERRITLPRGGGELETVLVPAGVFARKAGGATRRIRLTRALYVGKFEVLHGQFQAFAREGSHKPASEKGGAFALSGGKWKKDRKVTWRTPGYAVTPRHPVTCVSWQDAAAFAAWLNRVDALRPAGWSWRLPSEAEWEYLCRAGSESAYAGGNKDGDLARHGWYWQNAKDRRPQPAGGRAPNGWGLCDLHGNVWEWCLDRSSKRFLADGPDTDPVNRKDGAKHVLRGGSWASPAKECTSAARDADYPAGRISTDCGFRVVLASD